jgi:hypothetical protein
LKLARVAEQGQSVLLFGKTLLWLRINFKKPRVVIWQFRLGWYYLRKSPPFVVGMEKGIQAFVENY